MADKNITQFPSLTDPTTTDKVLIWDASASATKYVELQYLFKQAKRVVAPVGYPGYADYFCDGTDDDIQIGQAVQDMNLAGGGTVEIMEGTYNISNRIRTYSNIRIRGRGIGNTIIKFQAASTCQYAFLGISVTKGILQDLEIDGNAANVSSPSSTSMVNFGPATDCMFMNLYVHDSTNQGIYCGGLTNCIFLNCIAQNCVGFGFGSNASSPTVTANNTWIGCQSNNCTEGGFSFYAGNANLVNHSNTAVGCTAVNCGVGYSIYSDKNLTPAIYYQTQQVSISGCSAYNCNLPIQMTAVTDCVVSGNVLHTNPNTGPNGVYLFNNCRNNVISNNSINGGIVRVDTLCTHNNISNNKISNSPQYGMLILAPYNNIVNNTVIRSYYDGIRVQAPYCNVSNNHCINNSQRGANTDSGILLIANGSVNATHTLVNANICTDDQNLNTSNLSANASSGQKVVTVASTLDLQVGDWVTISDNTPLTENNQIASVDSLTQLTMTTNLANSYTTAQSAKVTGRTTQKYGIRENDTNQNSNLVTNNMVVGNITAQVSLQGAASVQANNMTT